MKKHVLIIFLLFIGFCANAQYKKAGLISKDARFIQVGTTYRILGKNRSASPGFNIGIGGEMDKKRLNYLFQLEYVNSGKIKYLDNPQTINGKIGSVLALKYTIGYKLKKIEDEAPKVMPVILLGVGYTIAAGKDEANYRLIQAEENVHIYSGLGIQYTLNEQIGLAISTIYNYRVSPYYEEKLHTIAIKNHLNFNVGLKIRITKQD